jgi:hypothetical protein
MHERNRRPGRWDRRRGATLIVVLAGHLALFTGLIMTTRVGAPAASGLRAVELLVLPAVPMPSVRDSTDRLRPLSVNTVIHIGATDIDSVAPSVTLPSASAVEGSGSGVDWAAEARRALQAYEIRKRQPLTYTPVSSEPVEDRWWPRSQHHAGEQYKTTDGDWIVWISDKCYQIATPLTTASAPGAMLPMTVCREQAAVTK